MSLNMNRLAEFPISVIEKLGYYVYLLIDPETEQVFYAGKGTGNRVFHHAADSLISAQSSDKLEKIRSVHAKGLQVQYRIHRHGMTEMEAFEVEAALIDWFKLETLTNIVNGTGSGSDDRGSMPIEDIISKYAAPELEITELVILITVNRLYRRGMSESELYEITRGKWVIGERRNKVQYGFSVYHGIVRQVYKIDSWHPVRIETPGYKRQNRWEFIGHVAEELEHYVGGSTVRYLTLGAQNPIRYVNC